MTKERLRLLPAVDAIKRSRPLAGLQADYPDAMITLAVRRTLDRLREMLLTTTEELPVRNGKLAEDYVAAQVHRELEAMFRPSLVPVVNATGVVIHTNLGRAPLSTAVWEHMRDVATGYSNLEYRLDQGRRGSRHDHFQGIIRLLTGAQDCVVVNNNAAAVLLVLTALARGREVIVSRGELIEIGGSFRIPEIMAQGGAILREVGTTNRTRLADFEAAVTPRTGLLMKAHRSNFEVTGFTQEASRQELAELAGRHGLPFYEDLGSGLLADLSAAGIDSADSVARVVAGGVDLVSFSGDKMFGGPQAGIVVGRADLVAQLKRHPLTRALRPDRLTLAGLEATALAYLRGAERTQVPVVAMLTEPQAETARRAAELAGRLASLAGVTADVVECFARVGGGAAPEARVPSAGIRLAVEGLSESALEERLRRGDPPVVARIEEGALLLDLKTVRPTEYEALVAAVAQAARPTRRK